MRFDLDDISIDTVVDLDGFEFPLQGLLPDAQAEALMPWLDWLDPTHYVAARQTCQLAAQSFLLRFGSRVVLVDTCVGCGKQRDVPAWSLRTDESYLHRLAARGVAPEQVDTVFCTHLHVDHVGWNTRLRDGRMVPTFPNARYLIGRAELAYWQARAAEPGGEGVNQGSFADSVLPILEAGQADLVDDGYEIAPGLTLGMLPGHTPAQMGLHVRGRGTGATFAGDAIHSPLQMLFPDWSTGFCVDPAEARRTRRALLEDAAERGSLLLMPHFRAGGGVRVAPRGEGFLPSFPAA